MEAKFLFFCLDREIGKVRNEFQHVAVGRRKNKDHGTAFPSMVFVGMMHHDAASCYHNACGLALYKLFWARHAPASAGAKKCRECLQPASPCLGWHWASAELMCRSRVSIDCLNVRLGAGTVLPVCKCLHRAARGAKTRCLPARCPRCGVVPLYCFPARALRLRIRQGLQAVRPADVIQSTAFERERVIKASLQVEKSK